MMKNKGLKRIVGTGLSGLSLMMLMPQGVMAEWKQNNIGYWYTEGSSWAVGWRYIDSCWFYFGADGYMKTKSWVETNGKWYFVRDTGSMLRSTTIDGYKIGADGAWIKDDSDNSNVAGWKQNSTGWWYLDENGSFAVGWKSFDTNEDDTDYNGDSIQVKTWYYFGIDGYMKTGWQYINGMWYYFKNSGEMASDENVGGYILGKDGAMIDNLFVQKNDGDFMVKILNEKHILDNNEVKIGIINNSGQTVTEYWHPQDPGPYWMEKYVDGKWTVMHFKSPYDGMEYVPQYINIVDIKTVNLQTINLNKFVGFEASKQGRYRIGFQSTNEGQKKSETVYAEFEVNPV